MIGSFETHLQDPDQMCGTVHLLKLDRTSKTSKRKELLSICLYVYLTRFDQLYTKIRKNHMKKLQGVGPVGRGWTLQLGGDEGKWWSMNNVRTINTFRRGNVRFWTDIRYICSPTILMFTLFFFIIIEHLLKMNSACLLHHFALNLSVKKCTLNNITNASVGPKPLYFSSVYLLNTSLEV